MTGVAVIVVGADPERARAALRLASASAALGGPAAVLFDGASVALLPELADELAAAHDLGVAVTACATSVADLAVPLPPGIDAGGMVGFLAANARAQLLAV